MTGAPASQRSLDEWLGFARHRVGIPDPIDENEAAAKRADFLKRWAALVAAAGN